MPTHTTTCYHNGQAHVITWCRLYPDDAGYSNNTTDDNIVIIDSQPEIDDELAYMLLGGEHRRLESDRQHDYCDDMYD